MLTGHSTGKPKIVLKSLTLTWKLELKVFSSINSKVKLNQTPPSLLCQSGTAADPKNSKPTFPPTPLTLS